MVQVSSVRSGSEQRRRGPGSSHLPGNPGLPRAPFYGMFGVGVPGSLVGTRSQPGGG
jgi:hypothetical protein